MKKTVLLVVLLALICACTRVKTNDGNSYKNEITLNPGLGSESKPLFTTKEIEKNVDEILDITTVYEDLQILYPDHICSNAVRIQRSFGIQQASRQSERDSCYNNFVANNELYHFVYASRCSARGRNVFSKKQRVQSLRGYREPCHGKWNECHSMGFSRRGNATLDIRTA